jgi:type II secretory pathway pseudopilin PulG
MVPHSLGSGPAGLIRGDERVAKASRNRAAAARARVAEQRAQEARRKRRRNWIAGISAVVVVIIAAAGITLAVTSGGGSSPARTPAGTPQLSLAPLSTLGQLNPAPAPGRTGPEGVPIPAAPALASTSSGATGGKVDGISCQTTEQLLFHIHAHLTLFVNGSPRQIPAGIGIPGAQAQDTPSGTFINGGTCLYWLHTHAADGIIHIESPVRRTFTLGQVFNEWGQPLSASQAGPANGHVTALYNGKVYRGNPRDIPLNAHAQIQLEVGKPLIAPESITFPNGL